MTAPNPARDARPGQPFTDRKGGTWVRRHRACAAPWGEYAADGAFRARSQEEAEAAGLVAVVAETEVAQARRERDEALAEMRAERPAPLDQGDSRTDADRAEDAELFLAQWPGGKRLTVEDRADFIAGWTGWHAGDDFGHECDVRDRLAAAAAAAPAPLDPRNPADLRRVADFVEEHERRGGALARPEVEYVNANSLRRDADRIERETAEKAQEAKDRAAVREILAELTPKEIGIPFDHTGIADQNRAIERALVFYRAGRAERQEAGQ